MAAAGGGRPGQPLRPKHVPQRTCVACRRKGPKAEFARLVLAPGGEVLIDPPRNVAGRGAYICKRMECWTAAIDRGRLAHTLKGPVAPEARSALMTDARERYEPEE